MATRLWFRDNSSFDSGIRQPWMGDKMNGGAGLSTTQGAASTFGAVSTQTGPAEIIHTRFISRPLSADITLSAGATYQVAGSEGAMTANASFMVTVYQLKPDGTSNLLGGHSNTTELGTSKAYRTGSISLSATALKAGDCIGVAVYVIDAGGTMASGSAVNLNFNGGSGSGDESYVELTDTLSFEGAPTVPASGTILYFTSTASDLDAGSAASVRQLQVGGSAPSSADVAMTVTGGDTSPTRFQESGNNLEWITNPLEAATFDSYLRVDIDGYASLSTVNVGALVECFVTDEDGTNEVLFLAAWYAMPSETSIEFSTTSGSTPWQWAAAIPVVDIAEGQRILVRLWRGDSLTNNYIEFGDQATTAGAMGSGTFTWQNASTLLRVNTTLTEATVSGDKTVVSGVRVGLVSGAGGATLTVSGDGRAAVGIHPRAGAQRDYTVDSRAAVGIFPRAGAQRDYQIDNTRTVVGLVPRAGGALFEPTLTNGRTIVGAILRAGGATPQPSAAARAHAGTTTRSGTVTPEPNAVGRAHVGAATRSPGATPDVTADSRAILGVLVQANPNNSDVTTSAFVSIGAFLRAAGSLAEPNAVGRTHVGPATRAAGSVAEWSLSSAVAAGVVARAGGATPNVTPISATLVGLATLAGGATPQPSAVTTVPVGLIPRSAPNAEIAVAASTLVGIIPRSQPGADTDAVVTGLIALGVITRAGATVEPSAAARTFLGTTTRAAATSDTVASSRAILGAIARSGGAQASWQVVARAIIGAGLRSSPTTDVLVTARTIAGLVARGVPVVTISATSAAEAGIVTLSVPTMTTTRTGLAVVGIVTYGLVEEGVAIVLPDHWATWSEPDASRYREPRTTTFREPKSFVWSDEYRRPE